MRDYLVKFWVRYTNRVQETTKVDQLHNNGYLTEEEYQEILSQLNF
jgi:hypothetical protein